MWNGQIFQGLNLFNEGFFFIKKGYYLWFFDCEFVSFVTFHYEVFSSMETIIPGINESKRNNFV